eukprot:g2414.t1
MRKSESVPTDAAKNGVFGRPLEQGEIGTGVKFSFGGKGVNRGFSVPKGACDKFYPYDKGVITPTEPRVLFGRETREQRAKVWSGQPDKRTVVSPGPIYPVLETMSLRGHPVLKSAPKFTMAGRLEHGSMVAQPKKSNYDPGDSEIIPLEKMDNYMVLSSSKRFPAFSFSKQSREPIKDKDPGSQPGTWDYRKDGTVVPKDYPSQFSIKKLPRQTFGPEQKHKSRIHLKVQRREEEEKAKAIKTIHEKIGEKNPARFGIILWDNKRSVKPMYNQYRLYG